MKSHIWHSVGNLEEMSGSMTLAAAVKRESMHLLHDTLNVFCWRARWQQFSSTSLPLPFAPPLHPPPTHIHISTRSSQTTFYLFSGSMYTRVTLSPSSVSSWEPLSHMSDLLGFPTWLALQYRLMLSPLDTNCVPLTTISVDEVRIFTIKCQKKTH